ncbi:MAG: ChbG/HpnK family deacetylase [Bacilli bacterium]|nr:ChbG/HpnK family deacetylase [Bacilli bacterium]
MLWVNADDFGFSKTITLAILDCFKKGIITTTTACVNGPDFLESAKMIKGTLFEKKVGLHINITEGEPLTEKIKDVKWLCKDGKFIGFPKRNHIFSKKDKNAIYEEIKEQFKAFKSTGLEINHVDSHNHIHNAPGIFNLILKIMKEEGVEKIRIFRNTGSIPFYKKIYKVMMNKRIEKNSYSSFMGSFEDLKLDWKKEKDSIYELMIHPDYDSAGELIDRENEDYSLPIGKKIEELIGFIKEKNIKIIK